MKICLINSKTMKKITIKTKNKLFEKELQQKTTLKTKAI